MTSSRRTCSSVERLGLRECATIRRSLADRHVGSIAISGTTAESGSSPSRCAGSDGLLPPSDQQAGTSIRHALDNTMRPRPAKNRPIADQSLVENLATRAYRSEVVPRQTAARFVVDAQVPIERGSLPAQVLGLEREWPQLDGFGSAGAGCRECGLR